MSPSTHFTPFMALAGGALIGLSAALLLLVHGRIAGISGILGGALARSTGDRSWRLAFLLGLPLGASVVGLIRGGLPIAVTASPATLAVAGLLVGFGTQLGNGCTSGHGVCGMARGSLRSVIATVVFITTGALTVFAVRHGLGS